MNKFRVGWDGRGFFFPGKGVYFLYDHYGRRDARNMIYATMMDELVLSIPEASTSIVLA